MFRTFKTFIFFMLIVGRHTILSEYKGPKYFKNRLLLINIKGRKCKIRVLKQKLITEQVRLEGITGSNIS